MIRHPPVPEHPLQKQIADALRTRCRVMAWCGGASTQTLAANGQRRQYLDIAARWGGVGYAE
jgi:hypothetical protein